MKRLFIFCTFLATHAIFSLERGEKYDFYQKNGQNLLHAELVEETNVGYKVKLSYLPTPLFIEKKDLVKAPVKFESPRIFQFRELRVTLDLGASYLTFGPLQSLFPVGLHGAVGAEWFIFARSFFRIEAIQTTAAFSFYTKDTRHIQSYSFASGPKIAIYTFSGSEIHLSAIPQVGASLLLLHGHTFDTNYLAFSSMMALRAEKKLDRVWLAAQLFANYIFDPRVGFASTGIALSVEYPFTLKP